MIPNNSSNSNKQRDVARPCQVKSGDIACRGTFVPQFIRGFLIYRYYYNLLTNLQAGRKRRASLLPIRRRCRRPLDREHELGDGRQPSAYPRERRENPSRTVLLPAVRSRRPELCVARYGVQGRNGVRGPEELGISTLLGQVISSFSSYFDLFTY